VSVQEKFECSKSSREAQSSIVVKGYSQVEGVNFGEILSPVAKLNSIVLLMHLDTKFDIEIDKMYVNIVFLHGDLEEEIYMKQSKGFALKGKKELVCKMKKSLLLGHGLNAEKN
jgi:hypothetical protein